MKQRIIRPTVFLPPYIFTFLTKALLTIAFSLGTSYACFSQEIITKGEFLIDSIDVGKPFFYSLSVLHKPTDEIFFPDTNYNFSPFRILSQKIFNSSTNEKGTLDSAIYQLVSFDVSPKQVIKVPVFVFGRRDCTEVWTATDTVFLKKDDLQVLKNQKELAFDTILFQLGSEFNFSKLLGIIAIVIAVAGSIYWVFGRDIYKQWQLLKLQRRHIEYTRSYNRLLRSARDKGNIKDAEKAIIVWKKYLERLEKKPFATYTTREIMDNMPDEELAEALKNMDGVIYGQAKSMKMEGSLEVLKKGATKIYKNRRRQILDRPIA